MQNIHTVNEVTEIRVHAYIRTLRALSRLNTVGFTKGSVVISVKTGDILLEAPGHLLYRIISLHTRTYIQFKHFQES